MAYGARLESVLGASPRGFESPILRQQLDSWKSNESFKSPEATKSRRLTLDLQILIS